MRSEILWFIFTIFHYAPLNLRAYRSTKKQMLKNLLHIILKVHKKFQVDRLSPTIKKTFPSLTNLGVKLRRYCCFGLKIEHFKNLTTKNILNVYNYPKGMKFCEFHRKSIYYSTQWVFLPKNDPLGHKNAILTPKTKIFIYFRT